MFLFSAGLSLLHSERPKLHRVLGILSAIGSNYGTSLLYKASVSLLFLVVFTYFKTKLAVINMIFALILLVIHLYITSSISV